MDATPALSRPCWLHRTVLGVGLASLFSDWAAVQLSYLESLRDAMQAWAALSPDLRRQ